MLAVALGVGFSLSHYALTDGRLVGAVRVGPWASWPAVGSADPDPYTRAYLSRTGILQLGAAEGVRFTAMRDSAGDPLSSSCAYGLRGFTAPAAFWTLEATDMAGRNLAASPTLRGLSSEQIARGRGGAAEISVSAALAPGNWLGIRDNGEPFALVITLYDVATSVSAGNAVSDMPAIIRGECW